MTRAFRVATDVAKRVPVFRRTVRGWMCVGLGVTAAAAYVVAGSPAIMQAIASNQILGVGALIVGLGLVLYLSARVRKMTDSRGLPREDVRGPAEMFGALAVFASTAKQSSGRAG